MALFLHYGQENISSLLACVALESSQLNLLSSLRTLRTDILSTTADSISSETISFEDRNIARAELAQTKLDQLRRDAIDLEMSNVQATPRINSRSRAIAKRGRGLNQEGDEVISIADRQTKHYQEELERRDRVRKEMEEKQIKDLQQTPKINKRSRAMAESQRKKMNITHQSIGDRQAERRKQELLRHEEKKRRQDQITMEEMRRTKPKVSRGSARILKKMEREGKRSKTTIGSAGNRLHQQAEVLQQKKERNQRVPKSAHTPNTSKTKQSAAAQAEAARREAIEQRYGLGTTDRLYLEAQAKEHRKAMATAESKLWERFDQETGEELFQPKITKGRNRSGSGGSNGGGLDDNRNGRTANNESNRRTTRSNNNNNNSNRQRNGNGTGNRNNKTTTPVHIRLARKKQEYDEKRQRKTDKERNRVERLHSKGVVTSEKSKSILKRAEKRGEMTPTSQRLTQNIGAVRSRTMEEMDHPTFRPKIHKAPSQQKQKQKMISKTTIKESKNDKNSKNSKKKNMMDRVRNQEIKHVGSPGNVAKHSSALSREEVIEYRKMQQEQELKQIQEKKKKVNREKTKKKQFATSSTSSTAPTTTTSRKRTERHATRTSTTTSIHQLPNRHRKSSPKGTSKTSPSSSPTPGTSPSTSISFSSASTRVPKKKRETANEDATANLLRARLLSSRRKTPTRSTAKKENVVSQQQQQQQQQHVSNNQETVNNIDIETKQAEYMSKTLPNGWSEYVNDKGFVYYAHDDGRSQWNTPKVKTNKRKGRAQELMRKATSTASTVTNGGGTIGSPSREELDNMIRGMGNSFLEKWKTK